MPSTNIQCIQYVFPEFSYHWFHLIWYATRQEMYRYCQRVSTVDEFSIFCFVLSRRMRQVLVGSSITKWLIKTNSY